jgi:hypothetical protein
MTVHPYQCGKAPSNPVQGSNIMKRQGKGKFSLFLSWDIHLLLSLDTNASGSQDLRLALGLTLWTSVFSDLQIWTE